MPELPLDQPRMLEVLGPPVGALERRHVLQAHDAGRPELAHHNGFQPVLSAPTKFSPVARKITGSTERNPACCARCGANRSLAEPAPTNANGLRSFVGRADREVIALTAR